MAAAARVLGGVGRYCVQGIAVRGAAGRGQPQAVQGQLQIGLQGAVRQRLCGAGLVGAIAGGRLRMAHMGRWGRLRRKAAGGSVGQVGMWGKRCHVQARRRQCGHPIEQRRHADEGAAVAGRGQQRQRAHGWVGLAHAPAHGLQQRAGCGVGQRLAQLCGVTHKVIPAQPAIDVGLELGQHRSQRWRGCRHAPDVRRKQDAQRV